MIRLTQMICLAPIVASFFTTDVIADQKVARLIAALDDANVRFGASVALTQLGAAGVPDLVKALDSEKPSVSIWSAYTLGEIGSAADSAVDALARSCGHEDDAVRAASVEALGKIGAFSKTVIDTLANALTDKNERVRRRSAFSLGQIGPPANDVADKLIAALLDSHVRDAARGALIRMGPKVADRLLKTLDVDGTRFDVAMILRNVDAQKAKCAGLDRVTAADLASLRLVLFDSTRKDAECSNAAIALASLNEAGTEVLIAAFEDSRVARTASSAFSKTSRHAVPLLIETLSHEQPEIRATGSDAIGHIGPVAWEARTELIKLLSDEDRNVRYHAVRALHSLQQKSAPAVPALIQVLLDPAEQEPTRQWAIKTLVVTLPGTHDAVVKGLIEASKEKRNYGVSQLAKQQLLKIDPDAAKEAGVK